MKMNERCKVAKNVFGSSVSILHVGYSEISIAN
jgi:hypothetical protein